MKRRNLETLERTKTFSRVHRRRRSPISGAKTEGNRIHARRHKRSIRRAYLDVLRPRVRSEPRRPPLGGRRERKDVSRSPFQGGGRGEEKDRELRRFVFRTFDQDVRYRSAFILSEAEIEPRSVPAPLAGAQELCIGSPCIGPAKPGSTLPQMPSEVTRLGGEGNELPYLHSIANDRPNRADGT